MRAQNILVLGVALLFAGDAFAQASSYQRPGKKKEATVAPVVPVAPSQAAGTGKDLAKDPAKKTEEKVDISDLEQKYWAPKDVEFSVVQNRLYSKNKRFALTASVGPLINDSYSSGPVFGITGNYYLSERHGVELTYNKYQLENSTVQQGFVEQNGTSADFNRPDSYLGASYNWVPIYGKMSVLDQKIIYYDMSFSPGVGFMQYTQQQEANSGESISTPALSLDIGQHFFLSKELAFRLDFRNRFYKDEVVKYRSVGAVSRKGDVVKDRVIHNITIQFGLTFYFGG